MCPGRSDITKTRSERNTDSVILCVIKNHRFPDLLTKAQQLDVQLVTRQRIKRSKGFIEQ